MHLAPVRAARQLSELKAEIGMFKPFASSLATLSLISGAAGAACSRPLDPDQPSPQASLEWMVLNEINAAYFDRSEPMNRPALVAKVPEGVITPVDISHDGVDDWLVDYTDSGLVYCGTGGCLRSLYVSIPEGGYVLAFNDQSFDFAITTRASETVIDTIVHPVMCRPMNDNCAYSFAWDPDLQRLVERPNSRNETLISSSFGILAGPEEDAPQVPESAPSALQARWRQTAAACPSTVSEGSFNIAHAKIDSIPDLDGDGVRDWQYVQANGCDRGNGTIGEATPFMIYLARPGDEVILAFTSQPGEQPVYDISTSPAGLISNPDCEYDQPCRNERLRWDAVLSGFGRAGSDQSRPPAR
ncbi:hypothetical protein [Brevundimonas sp. DC300-4]|uniref:hypothetical protein n=1 Tax=Brevundimonas sp. DC300-4 TaxID=2804594 RepID=UPI003CEAF8DB